MTRKVHLSIRTFRVQEDLQPSGSWVLYLLFHIWAGCSVILGCRAHHIGSPGFRLCSLMNRQSTNATKFTAAQSYMAEGCELNVKGRYMYPSWNQTGGGAVQCGFSPPFGGKGIPGESLICKCYAVRLPPARAWAFESLPVLYRYSTPPKAPTLRVGVSVPVPVPSTAPSRRSVQTIFTRACRPEGRGTPQECRPMFFPRIATFSTAPFAKLASDRRSCILCRASS